MAFGPGKYDDLARLVRIQANAEAVLVVVIGGDKGEGFSVQATADIVLQLPRLLRVVADQIEGSQQ